MAMSQKRLLIHKAPDFGAKEGDILAIKQQVQQITLAINALTAESEGLRKLEIPERVMELTYLTNVISKVLVDKGFITESEFKEKCHRTQMDHVGLKDKEPGSSIEEGDTIIMRFILFGQGLIKDATGQPVLDANGNQTIGEVVVEDQSHNDMAYKVGCKGLPCDDGMIGMTIGESRYFEVVFNQGIRKELLGKSLRMLVMCKGIKIGGPIQKTA